MNFVFIKVHVCVRETKRARRSAWTLYALARKVLLVMYSQADGLNSGRCGETWRATVA